MGKDDDENTMKKTQEYEDENGAKAKTNRRRRRRLTGVAHTSHISGKNMMNTSKKKQKKRNTNELVNCIRNECKQKSRRNFVKIKPVRGRKVKRKIQYNLRFNPPLSSLGGRKWLWPIQKRLIAFCMILSLH